MRKQLDPRIPTLINNNVKKNHRSFIVLVGDKGKDQVRSPRSTRDKLTRLLGGQSSLLAIPSPSIC